MLRESIVSEARIVSAFYVVLLQSACPISTCINLVRQEITHAHSQELEPRTGPGWLQAQLTPLPPRQFLIISVLAATMGLHLQRGAQSSPSGRNMLSLEGLKIPTLAPLVVAMRVTLQQLLEDGTRPLTQVPWLVPDRPHGWQRRGHLQ